MADPKMSQPKLLICSAGGLRWTPDDQSQVARVVPRVRYFTLVPTSRLGFVSAIGAALLGKIALRRSLL